MASVASVAVGGSAAGPAGAFGVGPHEVLAVGGGEVEEEVGAHAAAAGARPGGGVLRVYEIRSVRARGRDGVWVGRAGALGPGNRARSLALASTPAGSARLGSLGVLLPARVLAPLAPAAVLAGVPIAPMTFAGGALFPPTLALPGFAGAGADAGGGLNSTALRFSLPIPCRGRTTDRYLRPSSLPGPTSVPNVSKDKRYMRAASAKRVARFDLTGGSQRRQKKPWSLMRDRCWPRRRVPTRRDA